MSATPQPSDVTPAKRSWLRKKPLRIFALVIGVLAALVACAVGVVFLAIWLTFRVPEAGAEVDAATSEDIYQPVIDGAELVDESKEGASRTFDEAWPTRVERTYVVSGTVEEAAATYRTAAADDGWRLKSSTCSAQEFESSLTFNDPTNVDRGGTKIWFRPLFEDRKITDQVEVTVFIEISGRFSGTTEIDESHSCLDDHVTTLRANPPLRSIQADEMLERITPDLLAATGVGTSVNGHKFNDESVWFNRPSGDRLISIDNAEPHQIAALWGREPDEVFPFSDDRFDYWFIPVEDGALIFSQVEDAPEAAILDLAARLQAG